MSNKRPFSKRKMRTGKLTLPVDPDDIARIRPEQTRLVSASQALDELQVGLAAPEAIMKADNELADAQAALDQALVDKGIPTVTFTFRALSPAKLEGLHADHPPTPKQVEAFKVAKQMDEDLSPPDYDPETYTPALLEAACVKIEWSDGKTADGLDDEDAQDLWDNSSTGDIGMMMTVINGINRVPSLVSDLGKDSGAKRGSAPSPTTAAPGESQPSSS